MGYVQALALLGPKTRAYVAAGMAAKRLDAPNAFISAIVDGQSKAQIDAMTSGDLAARHPGFLAGTVLAIEALLISGTVPANATAFEAALP